MDHAVTFRVQHAEHMIHGGDVAVKLFFEGVGAGAALQGRAARMAVTGACICQLFTLWKTTAGIW